MTARHPPVGRPCRNMKIRLFAKRRVGRGCWTACREAACQRLNETLPKDLDLQPLTVWIQGCQPYEDIPS